MAQQSFQAYSFTSSMTQMGFYNSRLDYTLSVTLGFNRTCLSNLALTRMLVNARIDRPMLTLTSVLVKSTFVQSNLAFSGSDSNTIKNVNVLKSCLR